MKQTFLALLTASFIFVFSHPAQAQTIDAQGEAKLKTLFQDFLDYQKTTNDAFGGLRFDYEGELTVQQADTFYEITFPVISVKPPEIESTSNDDKVMMRIAPIRINAVPAEDGLWTTTWTIPQKLTLQSEDAGEDFHIEFGDQKTVGVMSEALGYFTKLNMNLYDMTFKLADEDIGTKVGGVNIFSNFEKTANQPADGEKSRYTGPFNITFSDIEIAPPQDPEVVKIGEFKVVSNLTDAVLPTLKEYEAIILKYEDTFNTLNNIDPDSPESVEGIDNNKIIDMIFELYDMDMSGFDFAYQVKDVSYLADQRNERRPFDEMTLSSASFSIGTKSMNTETGIIMLGTQYDGLNVKGEKQDELGELSPNAFKFNLSAENVPFLTLSKLATTTLRSIAENPDSAQFAAMGIMFKLPAILAQANTKLSMTDNYAKAKDYNVSLDGEVLTDLTAISGFVAKFTSIFAGMDTVIQKIRSYEQKQHTKRNSEDGETSEFAPSGLLENLMKLKDAATPAGQAGAYKFEFEATPEGKFLLNGQDAMQVLQ